MSPWFTDKNHFSVVFAVLLPSVLSDGYGHSSHGIGTACIVKVSKSIKDKRP